MKQTNSLNIAILVDMLANTVNDFHEQLLLYSIIPGAKFTSTQNENKFYSIKYLNYGK